MASDDEPDPNDLPEDEAPGWIGMGPLPDTENIEEEAFDEDDFDDDFDEDFEQELDDGYDDPVGQDDLEADDESVELDDADDDVDDEFEEEDF